MKGDLWGFMMFNFIKLELEQKPRHASIPRSSAPAKSNVFPPLGWIERRFRSSWLRGVRGFNKFRWMVITNSRRSRQRADMSAHRCHTARGFVLFMLVFWGFVVSIGGLDNLSCYFSGRKGVVFGFGVFYFLFLAWLILNRNMLNWVLWWNRGIRISF